MKFLNLREPTEDEKEATKWASVHGYLSAYQKVIPFNEWTEDAVLFVPNWTPSVRATIHRSMKGVGFQISSIAVEGGMEFRIVGKLEVRKHQVIVHSREWDIALPYDRLLKVRDRRSVPDGEMKLVRKQKLITGEDRFIYPWRLMEDGDYFFVPLEKGTKEEIEKFRRRFREAACVNDYEISTRVIEETVEGEARPYLRITRIQGDFASLKRLAGKKRGKHVIPSTGRAVKTVQHRDATLEKRAVDALVKLGMGREGALKIVRATAKGEDFQVSVEPETQDSSTDPFVIGSTYDEGVILVHEASEIEVDGTKLIDLPPLNPKEPFISPISIRRRVPDSDSSVEPPVSVVDSPGYDRKAIMAARLAALAHGGGE
jgi:hypothetical protein